MEKRAKKYARMKTRLFRKIQPLLESYGVQDDTILDAIEKVFREMKRERCNIRQWILSLVCRKIFKDKRLLLISPRTPAGNPVPFDVLATAHALWRQAQKAAALQGMDDIEAGEAMIRIVNVVADRRARGIGKPIRDMRKYMIAGFLNVLRKMAKKPGIGCCPDFDLDEEKSDEGAFITALENLILRDEILAILPPKIANMVFLRYMMGYSCRETADIVGTSNGAVRKALCIGVQKYLGVNLNDLRAGGLCGRCQNEERPPEVSVADEKPSV